MPTQVEADTLLRCASFTQAKMAIPPWYTIFSGCTLAMWLLIHDIIWLVTSAWMQISYFILKHIVYPHLSRRLPFTGVTTIYKILVGMLYIALNILCITVGVQSWADVNACAASMSAINLNSLLCGPRLVIITQLLGISLRVHFRLHKWFSRIAIAQTVLHTVLSVIGNMPYLWTMLNLSGVLGSSPLGFIHVPSLSFARRLLYESLPLSHYFLTIAALVALWLHLSSKKFVGKISLQIGIYLWTLIAFVHGIYIIFRNFALKRSFATARVTARPGAMEVTMKVPKSWPVKPGQWVFLSIPGAGITSALQNYPFMIVWWDHTITGLTISLLVKSGCGFSNRLARIANRDLAAYIDGPYGLEHNFGEYEIVLMFATGIGIAGHMSYIKDLVRGYNSCEVRTRRIVLVCQFDNENHQNWVNHWMDELIKMDTGFILQIFLHVPKRSISRQNIFDDDADDLGKPYLAADIVPHSDHGNLTQIFGPPNVEEILNDEFRARKGTMIVSICANNNMANRVRTEVQNNMDTGIRLVELDFQPSFRSIKKASAADMSSDLGESLD